MQQDAEIQYYTFPMLFAFAALLGVTCVAMSTVSLLQTSSISDFCLSRNTDTP
jgi:hypothetical protein